MSTVDVDWSLRPATDDDTPFVRGVFHRARESGFVGCGLSTDQLTALLDLQFAAQRNHFRQTRPTAVDHVVTVDGEPAGRIYLSFTDDDCRVLDIALLPAFRNRGVGTALLRDLQRRCAAGNLPLRLDVRHDNPARRLYERLGLRPYDHTPDRLRLTWTGSTGECPTAFP